MELMTLNNWGGLLFLAYPCRLATYGNVYMLQLCLLLQDDYSH